MFTGLIQHVGRIVGVAATPSGRRLRLDVGGWPQAFEAGESIAIDGCCLTLVSAEGGVLAFDAVPQTLERTTLGRLAAGDRVNLERSCTPHTLLGGHIVQGHVDGVGEVLAVERDRGWRVRVGVPVGLLPCVVPRGSIAVQGVSLTVATVSVEEGWFEVALIPETLERTTLGGLEAAARVNLEGDVLARTVVHWLEHFARPGFGGGARRGPAGSA